jgi:hypothetical protein
MSAASDRKVVLITRKTRLEDLIAKYLTAAQAKFYVEHLGADFSDYQREHDVYQEEQHRVLQTLEQWGRYQIIERSFLPNFMFGPSDIVVALGQDGVVANTMKYLDSHPLDRAEPRCAALRRHPPTLRRERPARAAAGGRIRQALIQGGDHGKGVARQWPGAACRQRSLHRRAFAYVSDL